MERLDLNLLTALDALLAERNVTAAARRLGLSVSATSRTLARLRAVTGDPLLVRAGHVLALTPRAVALRERVHALAREARAVLSPADGPLDLDTLERTFTLRANEAFIERLAVPLLATILAAAPRARLCFLAKPDRDAEPLRDGAIDLEIGRVAAAAPDLRARRLFGDRYVGVARPGHPLLDPPGATVARYAACRHVAASPGGEVRGPVDEALEAKGLRRDVRVVVPGFTDAVHVARHTDLVALVPRSCLGDALETVPAGAPGVCVFDLPVPTPAITISAIWHPRLDADPAHRWLRDTLGTLCRAAYPEDRPAGGVEACAR